MKYKIIFQNLRRICIDDDYIDEEFIASSYQIKDGFVQFEVIIKDSMGCESFLKGNISVFFLKTIETIEEINK